ncbi:hypothetical protein KQH65_08915 [archaeon]|nr:hypothetical protein [archaeon]
MISEEQTTNLEAQSVTNVVHFYREELIKIDKGEKATEHFNERQRKSLVKQGVLERSYGQGGCRLELTKMTRRIMREQA